MTVLGAVAYEAYSRTTDGKSLVSGEPLPKWKYLPDPIQHAWEAAAKAVRSECAQQLREHAETLLQDAIALVTEGNEAVGLPRVSRAAAIDSAANLLEPKEIKKS